MKNSILVLLIVAGLFYSCSNERETPSGQKFTIVKKGDGKEIDQKNFLVLNFLFKDAKDSVWNDSRKSDFPLIMQKKQIMKSGDKVLEVVSMLTKGDSAVFKISAVDVFTKSFRQPVPSNIDSSSLFTFHFGLINSLDSAQFIKFREELVAKQNEKFEKQTREQLGKDTVVIDNYLEEKNIQAKRTSVGLRYLITANGTGPAAKEGQKAKMNYAGHLLDGKYFDTNIVAVAKKENLYQEGRGYQPYEVIVNQSSVIRGWHEAIQLMNKGSKMTVYIPSTLAYGPRGNGSIPPNSVLVFELELVDLK